MIVYNAREKNAVMKRAKRKLEKARRGFVD
jgi:hypothetical protein